jgi:DNA-binding transcriptional ArsR family regulator
MKLPSKGRKSDALLHPVRLAIVQQLEIGSRKLTIGELATELPDIPQATLYRHVNALVEAGICTIVERRKVHSVEERVYGIRAFDSTIARIGEADRPAQFHAVALFLASIGRDFEASRRSRKASRGPAARFVSTVAHLTAEDEAELVRIRNWVTALRSRPVPENASLRLVTFMDFDYARPFARTQEAIT